MILSGCHPSPLSCGAIVITCDMQYAVNNKPAYFRSEGGPEFRRLFPRLIKIDENLPLAHRFPFVTE